jgi:transglutaminase-like putative cysteine protease
MVFRIFRYAGLVIAGTALAVLLWQEGGQADGIGTEKTEIVKRRISYSLTVRNTSSEAIAHAIIDVAGPGPRFSGQTDGHIESIPESSLHYDTFNNRILRFSFTDFPPYGTKAISISVHLELDAALPGKTEAVPEEYLSADMYCETGNNDLVALAKNLKGENAEATAADIFRWVSTNLEKTGYSLKERGAAWAYAGKKGDCSEFMHLFITLCRINDIPAQAVSGFRVKRDSHLDPDDFHDWARVFLNGRWRIADPYYNVFGEQEQLYIAFRFHGPRREEDFFHRWRASDSRLKISMTK